MTARYALYFVPAPESAWGRFGRDWLARPGPLTEAPRRYGFHATLKAPFRLARGACVSALIGQLDHYCAPKTAFELGSLELRRLGDFLAAVPVVRDARVEAIAADCVREFDRFRAPLTRRELEKRRRVPLSAREEASLVRWGYPHVLEDFRFHLTLTGSLEGLAKKECVRAARAAAAALARLSDVPLAFDAITLFTEPAPGAAFRELHRSPFRRRGRLIYVVGPSGAGKDSLLAWVRSRLPPGSPLAFARRTITRPAPAKDEQHEPVSDVEFDARLARGAFAMHWEANGHRYGIGREIVEQLEAGITVVVSGSRAHLPQARLAFRGLEVVHVTASAELRRQRLARRRRETAAAIRSRLARELRVAAPALELVNDGPLEVPAARLLHYLLAHPQ